MLGSESAGLATTALARAIAGDNYIDVRRSTFQGESIASQPPSPEVNERARALVARNLDVARQVGIGGIPIYVLEDRVKIGALNN